MGRGRPRCLRRGPFAPPPGADAELPLGRLGAKMITEHGRAPTLPGRRRKTRLA